jgi:hypothetical protein
VYFTAIAELIESFNDTRKAPKKVVETKIDFKKKPSNLSFDELVNGPPEDVTTEPVTSSSPKASLSAARGSDKNNVLPDSPPAAHKNPPPMIATRRKRGRFVLKPLPVVDCSIFKGLSGKKNQAIVLSQSFALMYAAASFSYGNREHIFKTGILEELSELACVCQSMPRLMDYYIWTVDELFRDGFGDEDNVLGDLHDNDVIQVTLWHDMQSVYVRCSENSRIFRQDMFVVAS